LLILLILRSMISWRIRSTRVFWSE
jgi:hypothetical protein